MKKFSCFVYVLLVVGCCGNLGAMKPAMREIERSEHSTADLEFILTLLDDVECHDCKLMVQYIELAIENGNMNTKEVLGFLGRAEDLSCARDKRHRKRVLSWLLLVLSERQSKSCVSKKEESINRFMSHREEGDEERAFLCCGGDEADGEYESSDDEYGASDEDETPATSVRGFHEELDAFNEQHGSYESGLSLSFWLDELEKGRRRYFNNMAKWLLQIEAMKHSDFSPERKARLIRLAKLYLSLTERDWQEEKQGLLDNQRRWERMVSSRAQVVLPRATFLPVVEKAKGRSWCARLFGY